MGSIRPLSMTVPRRQCPECGSKLLRRGAVSAEVEGDDDTLWDVSETCIMCSWTETISNVRVGA